MLPAAGPDLSPEPGALVRVRGLGVAYAAAAAAATHAVQDLDLDVAPGEFVAVVGPSGCGKSTLLRAVAGLVPATAGRVDVAAGAATAFVFQDPTLLPWRTVRANVRLPLELRRDRDPGPRVDHALALVGLGHCADAHPDELSGGMRMRVALARALVVAPALLLLDEPFAALDELTRANLLDELLRLWHRDRFAALAVTHNLAEAVHLADRVLVLRRGRLVHTREIDLPRPRPPDVEDTPAFTAHVAALRAHLREPP